MFEVLPLVSLCDAGTFHLVQLYITLTNGQGSNSDADVVFSSIGTFFGIFFTETDTAIGYGGRRNEGPVC